MRHKSRQFIDSLCRCRDAVYADLSRPVGHYTVMDYCGAAFVVGALLAMWAFA